MSAKSSYENAKARGVCPAHRDTPAASGHVICQLCLDRTHAKEIEARKSGICPKHGISCIPSCPKCDEYRTKKYEEAKRNHFCPVHKATIVEEGHVYCFKCREKSKQKREQAIVLRMCVYHPDTPALPNKKTCDKCEKNTAKRRQDAISLGKCSRHPKRDAVEGTVSCEACLRRSSDVRNNFKVLVYAHYGMMCQCARCPYPEPGIEFLTIDHVENNGSEHRKQVGTALYQWLVKNLFPDGFQTLCINCNFAKGRNKGVCPHLTREKQQ